MNTGVFCPFVNLSFVSWVFVSNNYSSKINQFLIPRVSPFLIHQISLVIANNVTVDPWVIKLYTQVNTNPTTFPILSVIHQE